MFKHKVDSHHLIEFEEERVLSLGSYEMENVYKHPQYYVSLKGKRL